MNAFDLVSFGSVYADINFFDVAFDSSGIPAESEVVSDTYRTELGGSAVICPLTAQHLGLSTAFIGRVGSDIYGQFVQKAFDTTGITPFLSVSSTAQTNISANFTSINNQTIYVTAGAANQELDGELILKELEKVLPKTRYLYLGGLFKLPKIASSYPQILDLAKKHKVLTVLDHGRVNNATISSTLELFKTSIVKKIDYYLPSEEEFCTTWQVSSVEEGLKKDFGTTAVIVKKGAEGCLFKNPTGEQTVCRSFPVKVRNLVGAGDSFNAGLISALSKKLSLADAVEYATAVAAKKISSHSYPSPEEVQEMLESRHA